MKSMKERAQESERVAGWAYREFNNYTIAKAGEPIDDAPVWLGAQSKVPAAAADEVTVTLPRSARRGMKVTAVYDQAVKAPIAKGQPVGKLVVSAADADPLEVPLVATQAVDRLDAFSRVGAAAGYLLWGKKN